MKSTINKLLGLIGLRLSRVNPASSEVLQLLAAIRLSDINTVLDVGANTGQFANNLRQAGYMGRIVSFEPLSKARQKLASQASTDPAWIIHPQAAIGDSNGTIEINVSANSVSSSILPIRSSHTTAAPSSQYVTKESVEIITLDQACIDHLDEESRVLIKIDAQGFEDKVLKGADMCISRSHVILCELSLVELYTGQLLWRDMIAILEDKGFSLWAIQKGFTDPRTGQTLQVDGIFTRNQFK